MTGQIRKRNTENRKKNQSYFSTHLCNAKYFTACFIRRRFGHHARCARKIPEYKTVKYPSSCRVFKPAVLVTAQSTIETLEAIHLTLI